MVISISWGLDLDGNFSVFPYNNKNNICERAGLVRSSSKRCSVILQNISSIWMLAVFFGNSISQCSAFLNHNKTKVQVHRFSE